MAPILGTCTSAGVTDTISHRYEMRGDVEGGSEGDRKVREEGRRGRGRREGEELRLYPELPRSQEFHPWKSSFPSFFVKFCKRSPHRSCRSHTRLHSHSRMRRQTGHSAQPSSTPPPWASPNSKYNHPWSRLEQTKSAAQGWPGSSLRGSGLARNAWQRTRPNMHRLFLHPT